MRRTRIVMGTTMTAITTSAALYRLLNWFSPSYPVGGFSYSHGLEWLVESGGVRDRADLARWITDILALGSGRNDAILFAHAHHATAANDEDGLATVMTLALAFAGTAERRLETCAQGRAFAEVSRATWGSPTLDKTANLETPIAFPVAAGIVTADHRIPLSIALLAYVHAFAANLVSAGVRLVPLGHTDGQRALIEIETAVKDAVERGLSGDLDDLGTVAMMAEMASMHHEIQYTRLFRT